MRILLFVCCLLFLGCEKNDEVIPTVRVSEVFNSQYALTNFTFINADTGYIATSGGSIYQTSDGGYQWNIYYQSPDNLRFARIDFVKYNLFYSLLYNWDDLEMHVATTLKGSWKRQPWSNYSLGETDKRIEHRYTSSSLEYKSASMPYSVDNRQYHTFLSYVYFYDENTGFKRENGNLYRTNISCTSKDYIKVENNGDLEEVKFMNSSEGIGINEGEIYKTTDGGYNWERVSGSTDFKYNAIDFYGNNVIVVGEYSILISRDRGNTFKFCYNQEGVNINDELKDVHFINDYTAIATSTKHKIYKIEFP